MASVPADFLYKIVLLGDSGVGKSNIVARFNKNQFSLETRTTIGVDIANKEITLDGSKISLQLWDTAGQERFRAISPAYYRGADAALLVYDITKRDSFASMTRWLTELKENVDHSLTIVLIGNKSDLHHLREVSIAEAQALAETNSLHFMETSARNAVNIEEVFVQVIKALQGAKPLKGSSETAVRSGGSNVGKPNTSGSDDKPCCSIM
ncbi:Rab GTPase [Pelomyxa schiedti]|nr:Rab GTPase [Pelomyxa schiedti]